MAGAVVAIVKTVADRILFALLTGVWMVLAGQHAGAELRALRRARRRRPRRRYVIARSREREHLEARLAETRLQLLGMQLQPHFLFNTLNTIAEMVHEDPDKADTMIAGLSDLLRRSLDLGTVQQISLSEEIDLVRRYLEIQNARFGDRLQVRLSIDDGALDARVPALLLQPLVENAIQARPRRADRRGVDRHRRALGRRDAHDRGDRRRRRERRHHHRTGAGRAGQHAGAARSPVTDRRAARADARGRPGARVTVRIPARSEGGEGTRADRRRRGAGAATDRWLLAAEPGDQLAASACGDGDSALALIARERPDLVFLDVQMPGMDGFEVLERLGGQLPAVIFVTAHDGYALRAFEVHALDYLLKPFDADRFHRALEHGRAQVEHRAEEGGNRLAGLLEQLARERMGTGFGDAGHAPAAQPARRYLDWVMVKVRSKVEFLRTADIDWIEAEGNYVRLHVGKKAYLVREKIGTLEERLDPDRFLRVHRDGPQP